MKPKISVIIPVYNVGHHLKVCLDSIINQTLREIEIICVNDASTDGSSEILAEYAKKDLRIHVISHSQNQKLFHARQSGIKHATGQYITFVDADDRIAPEAYEQCYHEIEDNQVEILIFGGCRINSEGEISPWVIPTQRIQRECKYEEALLEMMSGRFDSSMCNKIYSHSLISRCDFSSFTTPFTNNEDGIANLVIFSQCKSYKVISDIFYYYTIRPGSASSETTSYIDCLENITIGHVAIIKYLKRVDLFNKYKEPLVRFLFHNAEYTIECTFREALFPEVLNKYLQACPEIAIYVSRKYVELSRKYVELSYKNQDLEANRWFCFGQLSPKRKIWVIAKVLSKKLGIYPLLKPLSKVLRKVV